MTESIYSSRIDLNCCCCSRGGGGCVSRMKSYMKTSTSSRGVHPVMSSEALVVCMAKHLNLSCDCCTLPGQVTNLLVVQSSTPISISCGRIDVEVLFVSSIPVLWVGKSWGLVALMIGIDVMYVSQASLLSVSWAGELCKHSVIICRSGIVFVMALWQRYRADMYP